jgi:hypothetical protein
MSLYSKIKSLIPADVIELPAVLGANRCILLGETNIGFNDAKAEIFAYTHVSNPDNSRINIMKYPLNESQMLFIKNYFEGSVVICYKWHLAQSFETAIAPLNGTGAGWGATVCLSLSEMNKHLGENKYDYYYCQLFVNKNDLQAYDNTPENEYMVTLLNSYYTFTQFKPCTNS